jgi:hypothetical protein
METKTKMDIREMDCEDRRQKKVAQDNAQRRVLTLGSIITELVM